MCKVDNLPPSYVLVTKSGNRNFLEPSGSFRAYNGTDLPLLTRAHQPCLESDISKSSQGFHPIKKSLQGPTNMNNEDAVERL